MKDLIRKKTCRLCRGTQFHLVINLGNSSLANELVNDPDIKQDEFPLELFKCCDCEHFQLLDVVAPERMFKNYLYVSGTSKMMRDHFRSYAQQVVDELDLDTDELVCDIGSNDSTLLKEFVKHRLQVVGVEPAENLATQSRLDGIITISKFFNLQVAQEIVRNFGKATLVTSNNCFAHLDDLEGFVEGVKELLADDGTFVFENAYLIDMILTRDFSQVYHEHLSYHSIKPLNIFFKRLGMKIFKIEFIDIHGGSIRVFVSKENSIRSKVNFEKEIEQIIRNEDIDLIKENECINFVRNTSVLKTELKNKLLELKQQGKSIAGVFASAKSTTILHYFDIGKELLDFIVDDAPEKIGKFSSGKRIPILSFTEIQERQPDYLLILSFNFTDSIIKKYSNYKGTWIIIFPELKELKL